MQPPPAATPAAKPPTMRPAIPPARSEDADLLAARRKVIDGLGPDITDVSDATVPRGSMGLALSGGGIRSATISLGLVQALARRRRLLDFDYLSTVSGGGYCGSFLTGLFVPDAQRGRQGSRSTVGALDAKGVVTFVERVLSYDAKQERIVDPYPVKGGGGAKAAGHGYLRNPIWWLREHGRYLAPNGPTDFGYAIGYLARNWLAMIYTFTVAAAAFFFAAIALEALALRDRPDLTALLHLGGAKGFVLSPLFVLPAACLALNLATGLAYWLTVSLRTGNPWHDGRPNRRVRPTWQFAAQVLLILGATVVCVEVLRDAGPFDHLSARLLARFWQWHWPWWPVVIGIDLASLLLVIGVAVALFTAFGQGGDAFTNELRRRLTVLGASFNTALAVTLVLALIDTAALALAGPVRDAVAGHHAPGLVGLSVVPAAAALIGKLPQWLGGGRLARLLGDHVWTVALVVGVALFGLVALAADLAVQSIAWPVTPWTADLATDRLLPLGRLVFGMFILTGTFTGFINLSSLHNLYSGKLTRAYLGASNVARLRQAAAAGGAPITENHAKDYIDVSCYQSVPSAAPLHLINTTLNETRSDGRSQLVDRDRKGVPVVFAPDGAYIDAARARTLERPYRFAWAAMRKADVESLGVGQLCAISGAAAGSGMGARTTLGGALAMTFANVRLGYWWTVGDLLPEASALVGKVWWGLYVGVTRPLRTYFYLWNEMTATYARANRRVYLSDGGHFENSGVYELLRREVRTILVCDNGADPGFAFEDLENLVRKARIDLGRSITVAPHGAVERLFGADGAALFLNGAAGDWRVAARVGGGSAFALLLDIHQSRTDEHGAASAEHEPSGHIVWLKPRLFDRLPPDVVGYGLRDAPFPQQTTGDQFFDEAQWESYRALGYSMGELLMRETKHGRDALRALAVPPDAPEDPDGASGHDDGDREVPVLATE